MRASHRQILRISCNFFWILQFCKWNAEDYVAKNWARAMMLKALPLVTLDQALFSFRFENYIPAGKAKRKQTNFSGSR